MVNNIQIISSNQINLTKWNHCISKSSNELIYAQYQMLNALCDNWSGLIIGDYETVLPLPWRQKFGVRYLYAPAFIQQLGFYGNQSGLDMQTIWKTIFSFAKFGDLFLNYSNKNLLNDLAFTEKTNFILDLSNSYPAIHSDYTHDLIKNLQKSGKQILHYSNDLLIEKSIHLFQTQYRERFPQFNNQVFNQFLEVCLAFSFTDNCITRTVFTENKNELLSSAVLLKNNHRLFLVMNVTTPNGRAIAANHFLLDQIIQEFSEENLIFDFEGSERKGIKEFYQSFHPENQPYFQVSFNKLPYWQKWIRQKFFNRNN